MATLRTWMKPDESVRDAIKWRLPSLFSIVGMVLAISFFPVTWKDTVVVLALIPIALGLNYLFYLTLISVVPAAKKEGLLWFLPILIILATFCAVILFAFSSYRHAAYLTLALMGGMAIDVAVTELLHKRSKNP